MLMGVAGAGKSMQGRMFADEHGYAWISTGELLRVMVTGQRRQEMLAGKLLNDQEVISVVQRSFSLIDTNEEFVLDGFPRTRFQAEWLMNEVNEGRLHLTAIINMVASREVVRERLLRRGRADDNEAAIDRRFTEYESVTLPIVDFFRQAGAPVRDVDADQDAVTVHDEIMAYIDNANQN